MRNRERKSKKPETNYSLVDIIFEHVTEIYTLDGKGIIANLTGDQKNMVE